MREETKYIVIHCSQTRPSQKDVDAKWIDRLHRGNGWLKIGYAIVITRLGEIQRGREDDEVQAAVKGYKHTSFNRCIIGGAKEEYWKEAEDNFTAEQWESLKKELTRLVKKYPDAKIVGHRDLDPNKFCPSFDVRDYLLHEDIPNYKLQDGLTSEQDLQELRDDGTV